MKDIKINKLVSVILKTYCNFGFSLKNNHAPKPLNKTGENGGETIEYRNKTKILTEDKQVSSDKHNVTGSREEVAMSETGETFQ